MQGPTSSVTVRHSSDYQTLKITLISAASDELLDMLEIFADANGEHWTFAESVGAKVLTWESGSHLWRNHSALPSQAALNHVADRVLAGYRRTHSEMAPLVAEAYRLFSGDPCIENVLALAHAVKGRDWRQGAS